MLPPRIVSSHTSPMVDYMPHPNCPSGAESITVRNTLGLECTEEKTCSVSKSDLWCKGRKCLYIPLSKPSCERFELRFVRKSVGLSLSVSNRVLIFLGE